MPILVAFASRHGATREIAAVLARRLATGPLRPVRVDLLPVQGRPDPSRYSAVVLGSPVYGGRWLPEGLDYAASARSGLRSRPTWLFSSGVTDGRAPDEAASSGLRTLAADLAAVEHRWFEGRLERRLLRGPERDGCASAEGDHRSWPVVWDWADGLSGALAAAGVGARSLQTV